MTKGILYSFYISCILASGLSVISISLAVVPIVA
jgi:hypothetical protein